jgi:hypothetical protein
MGRLYSVNFSGTLPTDGGNDILELIVPADACLILHELTISQSTEAGDLQSEQLRVTIKRCTGTTGGSGGGTPTPIPLTFGDAAAGITAESLNTTDLVVGGGAIVVLRDESFNVMAGMSYLPTPECRPVFSPGQTCLIKSETTPADAITISVTAVFEEVGG